MVRIVTGKPIKGTRFKVAIKEKPTLPTLDVGSFMPKIHRLYIHQNAIHLKNDKNGFN